MAARTATAPKTAQKAQRELEDLQLVLRARNGSNEALDGLMRKYAGFVRLKASSYFLAGGDSDDLVQEGMIGLYKAIRDFRPDKETSFRSFAELCVTRQIITAIKTATRFKHAPLNTYVSFSHTPAGQDSDGDCTLGDALPGPGGQRPLHLRHLDGGAREPRLQPRNRPLAARVGGAPALPRGPLVRADGGGPRLRHEDDRQRVAAGQAQDPRAPEDARSPRLAAWGNPWFPHEPPPSVGRIETRPVGAYGRMNRPSARVLGHISVLSESLSASCRPEPEQRSSRRRAWPAGRCSGACSEPGTEGARGGTTGSPTLESRRRDSNPRPSAYKALALPAELLRRTRMVDGLASGRGAGPCGVDTDFPLR